MYHINVDRAHTLNLTEARQAAEEMAVQLNERFQLTYHWQGDTLHFERSGVSGHIDVDDQAISIRVRLGFLLLPMRSLFESEIHRYLDKLA